ncbi:MAG TPA: hypothetical protein VM535_00560 [Candidatus Saccharimonadales bacterium]|nr:hypothetical protein [Candidatus Saccharimonadales bacterium]
MNKRYLHHLWKEFRRVRPWYFLIIAIVSSLVCVTALRANNQRMVELRAAVYQADKDNTDVNSTLKNLQAYVTAHMNTNLNSGQNTVYPPIQLKYTYERLVQAQNQGALSGDQLYAAAQRQCEAQNPRDFSGRNRVPCIEQYVQAHGGAAQPATVPDALYKFAFVSPSWSPDVAGWSLVIAVLSWLLFIMTLLTNRWLKSYLK